MGKGPRPEDWTDTVRAHHPEATAWVAATQEPCLTIRDAEVAHVNRVLRSAGFTNLPAKTDLPGSWLLAVIVCPGDDLGPIVSWAEPLEPKEQDRVQFYHHPDVDIGRALEPWLDAGLPDPVTYEVEGFASFHNQFGWEFNDQVYRDATGWTPP